MVSSADMAGRARGWREQGDGPAFGYQCGVTSLLPIAGVRGFSPAICRPLAGKLQDDFTRGGGPV